MNVGTTTIAATIQGFTAGRAAGKASVAVLMDGSPPSRPASPSRQPVLRVSWPVFRRLSGEEIRLQHLARIRSRRRFLEQHAGDHRQSNEQRLFVGVVIDQLDADRQSLHDFDEISGGVLRRQQRQGRTGPHGEAADPPVENALPAIHVDVELHVLTDAQIGQLRLFEVGVDPDLGERPDGHQALPGLHVVARIDVPARDHAADFGKDVAVAEVQFCLVEIGLGHFQPGLRPP